MLAFFQRFKPYTLLPGTLLPIPGSALYAQLFPTLWRIFSADHQLIREGRWHIQGPLKRFTVFQDLQRGGLAVISEAYKYYVLPSGEVVRSVSGKLSAAGCTPLLSLGVYKQQDLSKIRRRREIQEILPLWWRLAILAPVCEEIPSVIDSLFTQLEEAMAYRKKELIPKLFLHLYLAGFSEAFLPRLYDSEYQGILCEGPLEGPVPFVFFQRSLPLIQQLFVRESQCIEILPNLPAQLHCGRFVHFPLSIGTLSLEWTKKTIRRMSLQAVVSQEIDVQFFSDMKVCRLQQWENKKLAFSSSHLLGESLEIKAGRTYLWDCFRK